ncbi:MAG: hypothetical protein JO022_03675, partial [Acidobacteriaceae bacterium]|nr:hypothetical protein [Acidobacteriaceae bacterium]
MSKIEHLFATILDPFPGRSRSVAAIALLLTPVALLLGLFLRWQHPAPAPVAITRDHDAWIQEARQIAARYGLTGASHWSPAVSVAQDGAAVRQIAFNDSALSRARRKPPATVNVTLKQEDGDGSFSAGFNAEGDLLWWSESGRTGQTAADDSDARGREILNEMLRPLGEFTLTDWSRITAFGSGGTNTGYKGTAVFAGSRGDRIPVRVDFHEGHPVSASVGNPSDYADNSDQPAFEKVVASLTFTLIGFFLFYSIRLYRRRRLEGEIPRDRALVLIAIFGLCGFLFAVLNPESLPVGFGWARVLAIGWTLLTSLGRSLLFMLGGLLVAAAYATGEGEIREGWPGKLISFDALLAGRWFTRTTGASAVLAVALASWAFLITALVWQATPARAAVLIDDDVLKLAMGRNVYWRGLAGLPLHVSFLIVAGLFMPLAFVHRRQWKGWKYWTVLLGSPFLVDAGLRTYALDGVGPLLTSLSMAAVVTAGFVFGDVLAAVIGAMLYNALSVSAYAAAAIPAIAGTEALLVGTVLAALLPMMIAMWRGRDVDEVSVRPKYASNLAQRLSMRAEVNAARQAQLRLLPVAMPQRPDISVAAYCQPAGIVGGDFFDFFTAPDGRLGVFVASGGGLGLASALTIAMAKGFLWSEVKRGERAERALGGLLQALSGRVGAAAERTGLL